MMDKKKRKALLSDLIVLVLADDVVNNVEYDFIMRMAVRMEITIEEVHELFKNPEPSRLLDSELDRITHFYKLVLVMNVDRETHDKEIVALRNFGLKMGIPPGALDQILLRADDFQDKIIPASELIKIFRTYYN